MCNIVVLIQKLKIMITPLANSKRFSYGGLIYSSFVEGRTVQNDFPQQCKQWSAVTFSTDNKLTAIEKICAFVELRHSYNFNEA